MRRRKSLIIAVGICTVAMLSASAAHAGTEPPPGGSVQLCGLVLPDEPDGEQLTSEPSTLEFPQAAETSGFDACESTEETVAVPQIDRRLLLVKVLTVWGLVRISGDYHVGIWTLITPTVVVDETDPAGMNGNIYYKITDVTDQRKVEERVVINRFNHAFWGFHYDRRIVTDGIEQFDVPANHRVKVELLGGEGKLRDITDPDDPKRRVWLLASRSLGEQQAPAS